MAKPTSLFKWATAPGSTLEPAEELQDGGFANGERPPARWHNWLFNGAHQWFKYLANLHGEPEFLDKKYEWTGAHGFGNSVGAFANVVFGPGSEPLYGDAAGVITPRLRTIRLPLTAFHAEQELEGGVAGWRVSLGQGDPSKSGWIKDVNHDTGLYGEVVLPTGASVVSVVARVHGVPWFGADSSIQISTGRVDIEDDFLHYRTVEKNSGPLNGTTLIEVDAATDLPWLGWFDGSRQTLLVRFTGLGAVGLNWVQVTLLAPGP